MTGCERMLRIFPSASMRFSGVESVVLSSVCLLGGAAGTVALEALSFVVSVVSFFFGAIATSGGMQHCLVGVRTVTLLLAKATSSTDQVKLRVANCFVDIAGIVRLVSPVRRVIKT